MSIGWMLGDQRATLDQAVTQFLEKQSLPQKQHRALCDRDQLQGTTENALSVQEGEEAKGSGPKGASQEGSEGCSPLTCFEGQGWKRKTDQTVEGNDIGSRVPDIVFPLRLVLCKTGQKDSVVWGKEPGKGNQSKKVRIS
jgi:hypothetical protein